MKSLSARLHLALGLSCLLVTLLLTADMLGLIPDRLEAERRARVSLAEAISANGASLATRADLKRLERALRLVVDRNPDLHSAAVRKGHGRPLVIVGDHTEQWRPLPDGLSTDSQIQVPLHAEGRRWGNVELRFEPLAPPGWKGILASPRIHLIAFLGIAGFLTFYMYLGRMLQHLDPSRAVPTHVRSALDTLAEGLMVLDLDQHIVLANRAFATMANCEPEDLVGRRACEIEWVTVDGEPLEEDAYPWVRALAEGSPQRNDMLCLQDGEFDCHTFLVNCSPVLGNGDKYGGVLVSLDDVTALEEHKAELSTAKEEAVAANEAKSDFLANMSHEIRTPMNAILGFTEVLRRGWGSNTIDQTRYLETIHNSGEHLLQLINDVLDLSKVESGHMEVESLCFAPHQLVHEACRILRVKSQEKSITLDLEFQGPIPESVVSDPTRLRQIVTNLVSNAIKFTPEGGVRVVVRLLVDEPPKLAIDVIDEGIGIASDKLEAIFDPFVQADSSVTRRFGGTGLGLPISRKFARLLGGDITAASDDKSGSTFTATVAVGSLDDVRLLEPEEALAAASELDRTEMREWSFHKGRVLVVDDGDENRELVRLVLETAGLAVEGAKNGLEGVEMARVGNYDAILMDVQMPVMDGFTATGLLREEGFLTPIIALTGNAMKGFDQECLARGFSGYVSKPIQFDKLFEALSGWLDGQATIVASPDDTRPQDPTVQQAAETAPAGEPIVSRLASNPKLHKTISRFALTLEAKLTLMETAAEAGDWETLSSLAHWLKGAGGTVGFDDFTEPALTLEELASERKASEIDGAIAALRDLALRVVCPGE